MPTPNEGETQEEFVARCIPVVIEDRELDADDEGERNQAVAICHSMWRQAQEEQGKMKKNREPSEHKTFPALIAKADAGEGVVETIFAVFGNVDEGGDVIHPGAFAKSFAEQGLKVKVLDAHNTGSLSAVIGKPKTLKELRKEELPEEILEKYPQATGGAYAEIQFLMNTPEGKGAFERIKEKAVDEWSFGYDALNADNSEMMHEGKPITVRNLRQLRLYEISPVIWGMNPATMTTGAKAMEEKAITDTDKNVIQRELRGLNMTDLVANHRRLHQMAAQGNTLTGFSRSDMNWFHSACESELRRQAEAEDRDSPEAIPLEWGSKEGEEPEGNADDEKHMVGRIAVIARREEGKEGEKAGRVLAQRNANRLASAFQTIAEVFEDAGLDLPGWTRNPKPKKPESDEENQGKTIEYHYHITMSNDSVVKGTGPDDAPPTPEGAGPDDAPSILERERLRMLARLRQMQ